MPQARMHSHGIAVIGQREEQVLKRRIFVMPRIAIAGRGAELVQDCGRAFNLI